MPAIPTNTPATTDRAWDGQTGEMERRLFHGRVELRTEGEGDAAAKKLQGYAAVFNEETLIGSPRWGFRERIMPGRVHRGHHQG
jgi:phage head maturation protease